MDEILIRIDVESDPAVVGIQKVERALHTLDDEEGRVAGARAKRGKDNEKQQISEIERWKIGANVIGKYRDQIKQLITEENNHKKSLTEAQRTSDNQVFREMQNAEKISALRKEMNREVLAQTGKTTAEITRMGKTIERVAAQEKKAADDYTRNQQKRQAADVLWERNRSRVLNRAYSEDEKFNKRVQDNADKTFKWKSDLDRKQFQEEMALLAKWEQEYADAGKRRDEVDKQYAANQISRIKERMAAETQMAKTFEDRAKPYVAARNATFERRAQGFSSLPQYTGNGLVQTNNPGTVTVSGANAVRAAHQAMQKADEDAYLAANNLRNLDERSESDSIDRRKKRWEKFFSDMSKLREKGMGGGFRNGGTRRSQFSDNPFLDTGGRGIQPRNLAIGGAIAGGAALAGPLGVAAGGLAGAIPGAVFGLGSAIAAIKMSGLTQVAGEAAKIRNLQAEIATGAIKEAKGRAQIAAILKQMSPEQKKALDLWKGFYKVTQDIGNKVSDVMLPAFGKLGNAIGANSGVITRSVVTAGTAMSGLITDLSKFTSQGFGKVLFSGTASAGNTFIKGLMSDLTDLGKAFFGVGNASQDFMKKIMGESGQLSHNLALFTGSASGQNSMKGFFDDAGKELDRVLGLVKDLGAVLITVFKAALPYSDRLIDGLRSVLQHFNTFLKSAKGQQDMKNLFDTITGAVKGFAQGVQDVWPIVSKVFSGIIDLIQAMHDRFGALGAVITVVGAIAVKTFGVTVLKALTEVALKEAGMALLNPWVAAAAGAVILIAYFATMKDNLDMLKQHAEGTAQAIRGVFDAQNKKKLDKTDLPVAQDRAAATLGSLGSAMQRLRAAQKARQDSIEGKGSKSTAQTGAELRSAQAAVNQLRSSYQHALADVQAVKDAIKKDDTDAHNGLVKAADNVKKAWSDALKSTQTIAGGFRGGFQMSAPNVSKASKAFSDYFKAVKGESDSAGQRVQVVMDKIAAFATKFHRMPSQKEIGLILKTTANADLATIIRLLKGIKDKSFHIAAVGVNTTMMDIQKVNNTKVADKTFSIIPNIVTPTIPAWEKQLLPGGHLATGGFVPGVDRGRDSVPTMLQPGEVVLNKQQQHAFGGPQVFKDFFGGAVQHFKGGGVVKAAGIRGDSPTSSLMVGKNNQVIGDTGTGAGALAVATNPVTGGLAISPMPNGPAEPGMAAVLGQLKGQQGAIKMWDNKIKWDTLAQQYMHDVTLANDYDDRDAIYKRQTAIRGKVDKKGSSYYLNKRKKISDDLTAIHKRIRADQTDNRHLTERLSSEKKALAASSKVFNRIPGYDAFQGQIESANNAMTAISYAAGLMPLLDVNADPNANNGINTLNNQWKEYDTRFSAQGTAERNAIQTRVNWLQTLLPGLKNQPKFTTLVNAESADDQALMLSILGKSLSDAVPSGAGPGDAITDPKTSDAPGTGNNTWGDQPLTQQFYNRLADDASTAAYALINGDASSWMSAMTDERDWTWGRLQDLQAVKDNPAYSPFRADIIDEITSDSGNYSGILDAIKGGFAQATGADTGDDSQAQAAIDAANAIMSQINLGSAAEREELGLLTDFLRGQVPSYATGTSYVAKTGYAKIHEGEQIISKGDVAGSGGYAHVELHPTGDALMDVLIQHIEPKITYKQGQSARRRSRERRR